MTNAKKMRFESIGQAVIGGEEESLIGGLVLDILTKTGANRYDGN
jgi:hypothetical protein